jgi:hypothetical protein
MRKQKIVARPLTMMIQKCNIVAMNEVTIATCSWRSLRCLEIVKSRKLCRNDRKEPWRKSTIDNTNI